jgi:hypothetical protein
MNLREGAAGPHKAYSIQATDTFGLYPSTHLRKSLQEAAIRTKCGLVELAGIEPATS